MRRGEEQRGLAGVGGTPVGGAGGDPGSAGGPLVVVLPPAGAESTPEPEREAR